MAVKIGINGFGRIGKMVFHLLSSRDDGEVTHINDKMDTQLMAHLLKYDSIHGRFIADIDYGENHLIVNGKQILVTNFSSPEEIPWDSTGTCWIRADISRRAQHCKAICVEA